MPQRTSFILSDKAYAEMKRLSDREHRSLTEMIRLGLGLAKIVLEAHAKGQKVIVTTKDGDPLKELVLPE